MTALQETFHMVFFAMLFGCIWGFIQGIPLLVTRRTGILPNRVIYHGLNPHCECTTLPAIYYFVDCGDSTNQAVSLVHPLELGQRLYR